MNTIFTYAGITFNLYYIVGAIVIGILLSIFFTSNRFKTIRWNFNNTPYYHIEVEHDGVVRDNYYLQDSEIKDGKYKDKWGREFNLSDIFNPIHSRQNVIRYTFKNECVLPFLNMSGKVHEIEGINRYEVLIPMRSKEKVKRRDEEGKIEEVMVEKVKLFVLTNLYLKNLLEEHFVEKIKKEAKTGWEAIIEWLKTPSGAIICAALIALIGFALWLNRH